MADESSSPIDIEINDKIDSSVAASIREIASSARDADAAVERLRAQLVGIEGQSVSRLTTALNAENKAWLDQETAVNRAIVAENRAAQAKTNSALAEQKLETEIQKTNTASLQAETALNAAVVAEDRAKASTVDRAAAIIATTRATETAKAAQAAYNDILRAQGISIPGGVAGKSAANSADVFKQQTADLTAFGAAQAQSITQGDKFIQNLRNQASTLGLTRSEIAAYRAAELGLTEQAAPYIASLKAVEEAELESAGAHSLNTASIVRESLVIGREGIIGNYTRMAGSLSLMAQYTGLLELAMSPLGIAIVGVGAAMGVLIFAALKGQSEMSKLKNELAVTGNYAGITADQFMQMSHKIADATDGSLSRARGALTVLISSGEISGRTLDNLGYSADRLSILTGESADKIAQDFLRMKSGVTNYAVEFNSQYHMLTATQVDYIRQLELMGEKEEAERALSKDVFDGVRNVAVADLGSVEIAFKDAKGAASDFWEYLKSIGRVATPMEQLNKVNQQIKDLSDPLKMGLSAILPGVESDETLKVLELRRDNLRDYIDEQLDSTHLQEQDNIAQQKAIDGSNKLNNEYAGIIKNVNTADLAVERLHKTIADVRAVNPNDQMVKLYDADPAQADARERKKYDPQSAAEAKTAESRAVAIEKINKTLDDEIARLGELKPARDAQAQLDRIEEQALGRRVPLSEKETDALKAKVLAIENAKQVQQQMDRVYDATVGPLNTYKNTLSAVDLLEKQHTLTVEEANAQRMAAAITLKEQTDVTYADTERLKEQNRVLTEGIDVRKINEALDQVRITAAREGKVVTDEQIESLRKLLQANQDIAAVSQKLDGIYNQNKGAIRDLAADYVALTLAKQKDIINSKAYALSLQQLGIKALQLKVDMQNGDFSSVLLLGISKIVQGYKGLLPGLASDFGTFFNTLADGFGNVVGQVLTGQESIGEGFKQLAVQAVGDLIGALVKLGIQWLVTQAIGDALSASATATSATEAATLAAAWAPAAIEASIATLGTADEIGSAAFLTALAVGQIGSAVGGKGFDQGGWTGSIPRNKVAGVVHGEEFVIKAPYANDNRAMLEAINAGYRLPKYASDNDVSSFVAAPSSSFRLNAPTVNVQMPRIVIEHRGTPQAYKVDRVSREEVRLIAEDTANDRIAKTVPQIMAIEVNNPNSRFSKSLGTKTDTKRRRN